MLRRGIPLTPNQRLWREAPAAPAELTSFINSPRGPKIADPPLPPLSGRNPGLFGETALLTIAV